MGIIDSIYSSFQNKYSVIIEQINSSCFVFIEELILSEEVDLQQNIDYVTPDYKDVLRRLLNLISSGLQSLNISKRKIDTYILNHYNNITPKTDLPTYVHWIAEEFQPKIQKLLFREILAYILEQDSIIPGLKTFDIVSDEDLERLDQIREEESELNNLMYWYFRLTNLLFKKCDQENIAPDLSNVIKFEEVERDIQSFYLGYRICDLMGLEYLLDLKQVRDFIQNSKKWIQQNPSINEKYPMILYCGIHLAKDFDITIDGGFIKNTLKKIIVRLVNNFDSPAFQDTFLVYYVIKSCELMSLKLTDKLVNGLTRFSSSDITEDKLNSFSTAKLAAIYRIYDELGVLDKLDDADRKTILKILERRNKKNLFYNTEMDFVASASAIDGAFSIYLIEDKLELFPVQDNISYISEYLEDNLSMFDFGLTGQLSELYYGINFIKKVLEEIKDIQSGRFSLYPLHSVESTEEIEYEEEGLWDETEGVSDDSADEWGTEAETPDSYGTEAELETPENVEGGMGTGTPGVEVVKEADQATQASQASTTGAKGSLPEDFWNFFGNMPALYNDIVDELEINFPAISEVKDFLFSDLAYLHKWISVLKMLNIKIPLNADQILTKTETFRMKKGFAKPNLRGERKYPDPVNTFYGLAIYSEFDILDRLDLKAIHEYLLDEANNINEYSILTNYSIFLSLRILDRNGFPMGDFSYLIPRVMSIDYEKRKDQYDALEDMIYLMTFIQTIDPDYDFSELSSNYHMEVQVALNDDGSINRKLTDTAKSFIVMNQLNMQNTAEAKFALKYIQYDTSYFNDIVKEEPLGWNKDELGYVIELNILYWGLLALTTMYPSLPSVQKAVICPNCNKFFHQKPKFCNKCGHQL